MVPRDRLFEVLLEYGVSPCMIETICRMYAEVFGQVVGSSTSFAMTMGVKQGCPASPLLFGLYFDRLVSYLRSELEARSDIDLVTISALTLFVALYADDLVLIAPCIASL